MSKLKKEEAIRIMKMRRRPDPGKEFWDGYWDRLEARMENDARIEEVREAVPIPASPRRSFSFVPRWAYAAAAGIVILFSGIQIGRWIGPGETSSALSGTRAASGNPLPAGQIADYFNRSKVILLSLANFDSRSEDPYALNLALQKQVSRELVDRGRELEALLSGARGKRYKNLIADLKTILVQIANLDPEENAQAVEIVRDGLAAKEILFKISIALISLRSAEEPTDVAL